jgi:peptidoglycan hydrolase CwlO-like protein
MVIFYRSPQAIVISMLCTIAVAAFIYFVIVKPQTDDANNQVNHALKQAQPQINEANKQLKEARPQIDAANKKLTCIQSAAGDVNKIAACNR